MNIPPLKLTNHITKSTEFIHQKHQKSTAHHLPTPPTSPEEIQQQKRKATPLDHEKKPKHPKTNPPTQLDLSLLDLYLSSGQSIHVKDEQYGLNLLCWATQCKSLEALQKILHLGHLDVNEHHGPFQVTALHVAAKVDFQPGLACLLQHPNLDLNQPDRLGMTALHYTVRSNFLGSSQLLLDAGARVDPVDTRGRLPIHHAIRNASPSLIRLILTHNERNNPTRTNLVWPNCLHETIVMTGNRHVLQEFLAAGAFRPIDQEGWWDDSYRAQSDTLIQLCVHWNRFDCFQSLMADPHFKLPPTQYLQKALELAVQQRKIDFVGYFCQELKVEPCQTKGYNSPLLYAVNHGFMEMVPYLLQSEYTSEACIQQAILFSKLVGKDVAFLELLKKKNKNQKSNCSSPPNVNTANDALQSLFSSENDTI